MIRALLLRIYLPALLVQSAVGMLVPVLPLYLRDLDLAYTPLALILAATGAGALVAELPIGSLLIRWSERRVMGVALVLVTLSTAWLGATGAVATLVGLRFGAGVGSTAWLLSRHTYLARSVPVAVRGRALSLLGGTSRAGLLIGPLLGGAVAGRYGFEAAFRATAAMSVLALVALVLAPSEDKIPDGVLVQHAVPSTPAQSTRSVIRTHWRSLAGAGSAQVCVIATRQGRLVILPLLAAQLGSSPAQTGVLVAIGMASDLALFPLAGWLMDTHGRLRAIVPSFALLGVGMIGLAFASSSRSLLIVAVFIGLGNGLGSGTMLTLGSDLAPTNGTGQYLGALGVIRDSGRIIGPLVVGVLADVVGLGASAVALGLLAFLALAIVVLVIGETLERPAATSGIAS